MKKTKKVAKKKAKTTSASLVVDRRRLARLLGVSLRHITELEAEGIFIPLRRGRGGKPSLYALEAALPSYLRRVTEATSGAEREARRRRDMAQAHLVELKIAREQGALVSREDVIFAGQAQVRAWSSMVHRLPRELVLTGAIQSDQERKVADGCRNLLTAISNWKTLEDIERSIGGTK